MKIIWYGSTIFQSISVKYHFEARKMRFSAITTSQPCSDLSWWGGGGQQSRFFSANSRVGRRVPWKREFFLITSLGKWLGSIIPQECVFFLDKWREAMSHRWRSIFRSQFMKKLFSQDDVYCTLMITYIGFFRFCFRTYIHTTVWRKCTEIVRILIFTFRCKHQFWVLLTEFGVHHIPDV